MLALTRRRAAPGEGERTETGRDVGQRSPASGRVTTSNGSNQASGAMSGSSVAEADGVGHVRSRRAGTGGPIGVFPAHLHDEGVDRVLLAISQVVVVPGHAH